MANEENANVVLTADTSGYTQGIQQATADTNKLVAAVDALSGKLSNLTKNVGRKLVLFSAADAAAMAGMIKLASNYEDQLQTLTAQQKIAGQGIETYRRGINQLARDLPKTRGELADLATQLKMSGVEGQKASENMSRTFAMLAKTTGSSMSEISQGMVDLSRQMGTLGSGGTAMRNFADSLSQIAATSGVSATNVLSFANAIAPASRAAGIGQAQVLGLATAFSKAGADGYAAANTFNGMLNEITRTVNNGSPDIAKYSNLIGVTVSQFKEMDRTEAITQIFEAINRQGPKAIDTLDRMGIDGVRALKSIQAVTQSGDLRASVQAAVGGYGSGATKTGYSGSATLSDEMQKIGNSVQVLATNIGETLLPVATSVAGAFASMLSTVVSMTEPLQHLAGLLAPIAGVAAGVGGVALQSMGALSAAAMAAYAVRGRGVRAFSEGFKGGQEGRGFGGGMGWANPIGRFAAGMGAYMPAEPGVSGLSKVMALPFRAASTLMRGQTSMMLESMRNGEDRQPLFGSSGSGPSAYREARNAGAGVLSSLRSAASGAMGLGQAARIAATDLLRMGAATTAGGVSAIGKGAGFVGGKIAKGIGSAAAGLGPIGLGLLGFSAISAINSGITERQTGEVNQDSFNPITSYNAALGLATESTRKFNTAVSNATATLYKTVDDAYKVTSKTIANAAGNDYVNPLVRSLDNNAAGAAFVRSLNVQNPQAAGLVAQDITKRYGAGAQAILSQGQGGLRAGDIATLTKAAGDTGAKMGSLDWWKGGGVTEEGGAQLENIVGSINQRVEEVRKKNGDKAAEQTRIALTQEFVNNLPKGFAGNGLRMKAVNLLEKNLFGGQIGYNNQTDLTGFDFNQLLDMASNSDAGKAAMANWAQMGLDVSGNAGKTAQGMMGGQISSYQVGINSTRLGRFTGTNRGVLAALASPSDATAFRGGYSALAGQALGGKGMPSLEVLNTKGGDLSKTFGDAAGSLEELKVAIGNVNDPLYQMAVAAQGAIGTLQSIAAMGQSREERWKTSYDTNAKILNTPGVAEEDRKAATQGMYGTMSDVNSYLDSLIMANRQYQRQMKRSVEDFNISMGQASQDYHTSRLRQEEDFGIAMKRQVEDAAKSIYDPYKRVYASYTESSASLLENLKDQNRRIQQQRAQVGRLRKMGVSQSAIDTLDLTNPQNAQQVARMVGDLAGNPALIRQINASISSRMKGTKALVQSPFSEAYRRSVEDFARGLARGEADFNKGMSRMNANFKKSQRRAAEDLALFGEEVLGTVASKQAEAIHLIDKNLGKLGKNMTDKLKQMAKDMPWLFSDDMMKLLNGDTSSGIKQHDERTNHGAGGTVAGNGASAGSAPGDWTKATGAAQPWVVNQAGKSTSKTYSSTSVDHSTNISINRMDVMADDPAKLAKALANQARIKKLARAGV